MKPELPNEGASSTESGRTALSLDLPPDLLAALDTYSADAEGHPDRPTLLLRIVRDWMTTNGYLRSDPVAGLDGEAGRSGTS